MVRFRTTVERRRENNYITNHYNHGSCKSAFNQYVRTVSFYALKYMMRDGVVHSSNLVACHEDIVDAIPTNEVTLVLVHVRPFSALFFS